MIRILSLCLFLSIFGVVWADRPTPIEEKPGQPAVVDHPVHHIVLCWLKEPGNMKHRKHLIKASKMLKEIPEVLDVRVGTVIQSERDIVDDSFDVGIVMTFASTEAMERYLVHPEHTEKVRTVLGPLCKKILVYDFLAED